MNYMDSLVLQHLVRLPHYIADYLEMMNYKVIATVLKIKKQYYPLDFIQYSHSKNQEILNNIEEKHQKLFEKIKNYSALPLF